jgi:hypothetical protein
MSTASASDADACLQDHPGRRRHVRITVTEWGWVGAVAGGSGAVARQRLRLTRNRTSVEGCWPAGCLTVTGAVRRNADRDGVV